MICEENKSEEKWLETGIWIFLESGYFTYSFNSPSEVMQQDITAFKSLHGAGTFTLEGQEMRTLT